MNLELKENNKTKTRSSITQKQNQESQINIILSKNMQKRIFNQEEQGINLKN